MTEKHEPDLRRRRRRRSGDSGDRTRSILWGCAITVGWVLVLVGLMCFGAHLWVRRTFGQITVDQLLMNLPGGGQTGLVWNAVLVIVILPLAVTGAFLFLFEMSRRALRDAGLLNGFARWSSRIGVMALAIAVPFLGGGFFAQTIGAGDYVRSMTTAQDLADYYVPPTVPENGGDGDGRGEAGGEEHGGSKNLVIVYLESVEDDLADDELFAKNMLEPVQRATEGWASIPNLTQYDGGGWTMAGLVATQCGIPLRTAQSHSDRDILNYELDAPTYLEKATCLSDVLRDEGYRNVFLGGADATFASKGTFLETHGYDEVKDLRHWRIEGETEVRSDWGLSDGRLVERAKEEVSRLHDAGEPFHLSVLTLDTHESVYRHPYCRAVQTFPGAPVEGEDHEAAMRTSDMTDITRCSMEQVAGFIEHMEAEGILDDTVVVLMGDHLKMEAPWSAFWPELEGREGRTIFNRIWVPDDGRRDDNADGGSAGREAELSTGVHDALVNARKIDQLSMYPTLLELTGMSVPGHRAGVGVSALAAADEIEHGTILDLDAEDYAELVGSRSGDFYRDMWGDSATAPDPSFGD